MLPLIEISTPLGVMAAMPMSVFSFMNIGSRSMASRTPRMNPSMRSALAPSVSTIFSSIRR